MLERQNDMRGDVKFACLDSLVPKNHLLRKIDRVVDLTQIYGMVEHLYRDDFGRPAVDLIELVKMVLIQHYTESSRFVGQQKKWT